MIDALCTSGLLEEREAAQFIRRGHFAYEGGGHGDVWLALELLFANPRRLQDAARRLASLLLKYKADMVCGPLVGGALVGQWVACELGASFVFAEPQSESAGAGSRYIIPGVLRPALSGRRAVIVDDVINAGAATLACAREIESLGGLVVAAGSLMVREAQPPAAQRLGLPVVTLLAIPWQTWPPSDCPLCKSGVELGPGKRA